MNYNTDKFTIQQDKEIFDFIKYSLENDVNIMGVPSGITLQILSKR